jgi:hypothetical protein
MAKALVPPTTHSRCQNKVILSSAAMGDGKHLFCVCQKAFSESQSPAKHIARLHYHINNNNGIDDKDDNSNNNNDDDDDDIKDNDDDYDNDNNNNDNESPDIRQTSNRPTKTVCRQLFQTLDQLADHRSQSH